MAVLLVAILAGCATSIGGISDQVPTAPASPSPTMASVDALPVVDSELFAVHALRPTPSPLPEPEPFAMNLYTDGDFVPQHTFEWCVAASIQMTWNMARDTNRSTAEDQGTIWDEARARSNDQWGGASGNGWAKLLTEWGVGEYVLAATRDYDKALRMAARAMRNNGLAVGLIMWRGRHAWVMSGFESIGDPAIHEDFTVTGIRVLDPLFPHGDGRWGPSPAPNTLMTPDELAVQFQPRGNTSTGPDSPPGYVLVLPVAPQT
jgi:hypothetical protein